ncbi:MAG TPA: LD-carboxypeptidase [Thermoanaerobaculia bacterium]|nr:LD-carboxypeptidase [Thermoanaerobaculia bacterium]
MTSSDRLRRPAPLFPTGTAAVLAISSPSEKERIVAAQANLEKRGMQITLAENLFARVNGNPTDRHYLAGADDNRLEEVNRFLRAPEWDAFMFSRGGYGAMRILDAIDYHAIARNPRPIIGYSDITALHQAVAVRTGISTFHGPMLNSDFFSGLSPLVDRWFWDMLSGQAPLTWDFEESQVLSEGRAEGILFGGCLSLTTSLMGTPFDYWVDDGIWFWEDVGEPLYKLDRMLTHLRLSGRFRSLQGVMIGRLKDCAAAEEIDSLLSQFFGDAGIPVVRDFPFGHHGDNLLLPIGALAILDTSSATLQFPEPAVAAH